MYACVLGVRVLHGRVRVRVRASWACACVRVCAYMYAYVYVCLHSSSRSFFGVGVSVIQACRFLRPSRSGRHRAFTFLRSARRIGACAKRDELGNASREPAMHNVLLFMARTRVAKAWSRPCIGRRLA